MGEQSDQKSLGRLAEYDFRWARKEEWKDAIMMVWKTFMEFVASGYSKEGIKHFFEFITDDDIYKAFLVGTYQMLVAVDGDRIIGVATVRNRNKLSLLFVDSDYHRQGIGRTLIGLFCRFLREEQGERLLTVKAAPGAVEFYRSVGFRIAAPEQDYAGIRVTPMEREL